MNHAVGAVTSLNPEPVKVGEVVGKPAQRRGLVQGSVRPMGVVEVFVLPQHGHKVALVPHQSPVEQLDPRLDGMLRGAQDPDAAGAVLDHGKDVHLGTVEEVGGEEVQGQDPLPCDRRNSAHPGPSRRGAGSIPAFLRISQTVDGATVMPSPASSPWIRR